MYLKSAKSPVHAEPLHTSIGEKFVISAICDAINKSNIIICDLTTLNHNVLFALGYSIAKKRRIWIILDPNIDTAKNDYEKFKLLTTVGYTQYSNSREITEAFYKYEPYNDLHNTIYKDAIESVIMAKVPSRLLYLKSGIETDASIKLSRRINETLMPCIMDDPKEVRIQTLSWYAEKVFNSNAVIVHFLSSSHKDWKLHNAKKSFVSGFPPCNSYKYYFGNNYFR